MQYIHCKILIGVWHMVQKIKQDISIGDNIRKLRKQAHLTQEQVVARLQLQGLEISRSSYSQIECGTYNIRVSELIALTEIFNVDYNTIFENLKFKTSKY
jgi:transcriptional regulator with XRE-family HTH domain